MLSLVTGVICKCCHCWQMSQANAVIVARCRKQMLSSCWQMSHANAVIADRCRMPMLSLPTGVASKYRRCRQVSQANAVIADRCRKQMLSLPTGDASKCWHCRQVMQANAGITDRCSMPMLSLPTGVACQCCHYRHVPHANAFIAACNKISERLLWWFACDDICGRKKLITSYLVTRQSDQSAHEYRIFLNHSFSIKLYVINK